MKKISLTQGKYTLVDNSDFEWLNQWKWYYGARGYAIRGAGTKTSPRIFMHRLILNAPAGMEVDHEDGVGTNNQRYNLRVATHAENGRNVHKYLKGVYQDKGKWRAFIGYDMEQKYLGTYSTKEEAARAYNKAAQEFHGDFANLNKVKAGLDRGRLIGGGKLTVDEVKLIRALLKRGVKVKDVVNKFGITQPAVWKIQHGVTHKAVLIK